MSNDCGKCCFERRPIGELCSTCRAGEFYKKTTRYGHSKIDGDKCDLCQAPIAGKEYHLTLSDGDNVKYVIKSGVVAGKCTECGSIYFPFDTFKKSVIEKLEELQDHIKEIKPD